MCNDQNKVNNVGYQGQIVSNPNEGRGSAGNQEGTTVDKSNQNTDGKDADANLKKEQAQKQQSYDTSYGLTILVMIFWIVIMLMICFKINCIIASPNGWHILLFSISLLLIAFSLSGRLFRRFYPSLKSDKEDFNLHEVLAKSFDKVIDKLPDLLKIKG